MSVKVRTRSKCAEKVSEVGNLRVAPLHKCGFACIKNIPHQITLHCRNINCECGEGATLESLCI